MNFYALISYENVNIYYFLSLSQISLWVEPVQWFSLSELSLLIITQAIIVNVTNITDIIIIGIII